jgi:hypothetical protein
MRRTLMVCTELTGIRDMAMLENMCPPTWNKPMGKVFCKIALVGMRKREKRTAGDMKQRLKTAVKPNWTKVRVIG